MTEQRANTKKDLAQLWRHIVFYIAISNTDDHLHNHGFLYHRGGWSLSPACDINPVSPAHGLHLNITDSDNRLDYELAMDVIEFFQLDRGQAALCVNPALRIGCATMARRTVASTRPMTSGRLANKKRGGYGTLSTHFVV